MSDMVVKKIVDLYGSVAYKNIELVRIDKQVIKRYQVIDGRFDRIYKVFTNFDDALTLFNKCVEKRKKNNKE